MSNVISFYFNKRPIRVVDINGEPWFALPDVREILGIVQSGINTRCLDTDEVRVIKKGSGQTSGLFQGRSSSVSLISESGLYKLVLRSDKPEAKALYVVGDDEKRRLP